MALLDKYMNEEEQKNKINNNGLLDKYMVEPESVKEPSFTESHPMLASIPGKVGNAFNNVSNAIQTGLNKYGEAQALNGQGYSQMFKPNENGVIEGGVKKNSFLNDQRYWLKTKANNIGDKLLRQFGHAVDIGGGLSPGAALIDNILQPEITKQARENRFSALNKAVSNKETPTELKIAGSRNDYEKLKEYRRNPELANLTQNDVDNFNNEIELRKNILQGKINNGEVDVNTANKVLQEEYNDLLKKSGLLEKQDYSRIVNQDLQRKIQNVNMANEALNAGFWTTFALELLTAGAITVPLIGGKVVQKGLKNTVEKAYIQRAIANGVLEADAKAMVKEASQMGLTDIATQKALQEYSNNFITQGVSNAATRLMGKIATQGTIAAGAGAIDLGLLNAGTNEYGKYLGISDTPTWQAALEGIGHGAVGGYVLGGGATALSPVAKAIGNIPLKTTYEKIPQSTDIVPYVENPNIKYGYANGNGFYTPNPNVDIPKEVNIEDIAPNVTKKQQAKKETKLIENKGNKLVEAIAPKTAEKTNQIADTSKIVNSNEEKIAKLESKIQMVGKDTMLGKKYQAQIDELRGTVQPSEQVSEQVKQEIISQDYKDSVKEYTQEQHKNAVETYGNKMADAAKKANAGIGKDDNGQQYNENKQKFEEYKALKDYHEEQIKPQEIDFNKINNGAIWKNETWGNIFNKLKEKNDTNKYWIEKVNKSGDSLLSDDVFSHYQLKSEEGYKVKIPSEYNEYIKNTFNDDKYIGTVKPQEATVSKTENIETTPTNEENSVVEEKPVVRENSTTENTVNSNRKYTYDVGNLKVKNGLTIPQREEIIETILNEYKGNLYPDVETKYIFDRIKNPEIENDTYIKEVEKDIIPINIKGSRISYNIYKNPQSIRIFLDKLGIKIKDNIAGAEQYTNPKNVKLPKFIKEHHNYINDYIYDGDYISDGSFAIKKEYANITDKNLLEKIINNDITKDFNVSKIIQTSGTKPLEDLNKLTKLEDGNLKLRIYKNAKGNNVYVDEKYAKLFDNAILEQHDFGQIIARDKDGNIIGLVMPIQEKAGAKFSSPIPAMNQKTFMSKHKGEYPHIKQQNKQEIKKSNTEFNQIGKENEVSGSRTEDVKVYTDLLHDKLSKVLGIPKETLDKSLTVKETNEVKYADDGLNQSAMHKNDRTASLKDFVDNIYSKTNLVDENEMKQIGDKNVFLPKGVVIHDNNRHRLSSTQWQDIEENIDNIFTAKKSDEKNSYSENNYKIGIKTNDNKYYGLVIGINKKYNYICTALNFNTKNGVEAFVEDRGKIDKKKSLSMMPSNQPMAPVGNNANFVVSHSKDSNNIIAYIKSNFNSNTLNQTQDITKTENFKKWFKDSKVVDKKGNPLVVYHGTTSDNIEIFEPNQSSIDFDYPKAIYFTDNLNIAKTYGDTYHKNPMRVYLKMENPLELNAKSQTYNDFYDELKREMIYAKNNNNYDGIIVKNIRDDWAQKDGGEIATTYIVFNPEQIKSVYNNGLFDSNNPNIYYQTGKGATNKIEQSVRDFDIENVDEILKKVKKEPDEVFKNIFTPISSRLDEISPSLKHAIRKFELNSALAENKSAEIVKPFIEKLSKMDKVDYAKYDLALKNGNKEVIDKINSKYNIGDDYKSIKKLLSNIRQEAIQNGLEVGEIEDYFPRKVINPSALLEEYSKSSYIKNYLKEIDPNNKLTTEEKINKINTALKGYNGAIKASSSFTKGRKISEIDKNLNRYYKDSKEALVDYITSMNNAIQTRKFFGNSEENIENSIGAFTKNLIDNGIIKPSDEVKLKKLLTSRFTQRSMHGAIKSLKNVGYITTMGNPLSAVTQLGDFAFSLYKNGIINTLSGVKDSVFKTDKITKKDLGIDRIAQEFENDCKTGKIVDKVFKIVGLNKIDSLAKETFINGAMNRNKKSAINALENINSKEAKEYYNYLHNIFGNETYNVLEDLKNEKLSDNVKYLLFSEISDFQPISLSEMPEAYLKSGNGRIFYMLKTYSIKLLDVYRNETYRQFKAGNKKKSIANLIKLGFYLTLLGVTSDKIKDKMLGRDSDIGDTIVDNILKMAMFSKYQLDKSKTEGIGKTIYSNILPPSGFIDDVWKDVQSVAKDNYNIKDFKTFRNIPVIGKMYYWWFGGGVETRDKEAKSKYKNEYKKAIEKNNIKLEEKIDKELSSKGYSKKETDKIYKNASQSITKMYVNQYYKAMKNNSDKGISSVDKKLKKLGYTQDEIDYFYNKAYDKYDKELYEE